MASLDLTKFLPAQYRDKTIDSLLKNLFNRHLSKSDTVSLFGYIGDHLDLQPGEVQITEGSLERQINQLIPFIYAEHATEKKLYSWYDLVTTLASLGVDYASMHDWLQTKSYNFAPPIDLDKFCNFQEYYWIGTWLLKNPTYTYNELGLANAAEYHLPAFNRWGNSKLAPEYYVIKRGDLLNGIPVSPISTLPQNEWSDWSYTNLWVHRDDALNFLETHNVNIGLNDLIQATRPIIEYSNTLSLNFYQTVLGVPSDHGVFVDQVKVRKNQLPLFDLYDFKGEHSGLTSAIFYYQEGQQYGVDSVLERRVAVDSNNDFIFEHSLVADDGSLRFYKDLIDSKIYTVWKSGEVVNLQYSKYDTSGTLINRDKFVNFRNYYWTGTDSKASPSYNPLGLPTYSVIEQGGTSDWSKYNYWTHVSALRRSDLSKYVQAVRPIIEFNVLLESELLAPKTEHTQLPRFKHYVDENGVYKLIGTSSDVNLNDAYFTGHLVCRLVDLPINVQAVVLSNPDVAAHCFSYDGTQYVQSLDTGAYYPSSNGTVYGYKARLVTKTASGNGSLMINGCDSTCYPGILTFTFNSGRFSVSGSHSSAPDFLPGDQVTVDGVKIRIDEGNHPFMNGDSFTVEILSYVYESRNLYVNLDGTYRTLSSPDQIYNEVPSAIVINSDPSNRDGIWEVPPQLEWNVLNETRKSVKQGDLYFHFISIIQAQPGLIGSSSGNNNWRSLSSHNLGLGGKIKQFDGNFSLLVSILLQQGISISSLLDFMRESYQGLSTSIRSFVEEQIPDLLNSGSFIPPTSGDTIDPIVVKKFKEYFSTKVPTSTTASPFYDSTSSIYNLVTTLPYLGLSDLVEPKKVYDLELNLNFLQHHDGHLTELASYPVDLAKKIVMKTFLRSPGQETPGIISGFDYPQKPYRGQFWFKTSTGQLFMYSTVSDTGELPSGLTSKAYSYDRETDKVWLFTGSSWNYLGNDSTVTPLPWVEVKLDLILQNLELSIEKELYENCPPLTSRLDVTKLESDSHFTPLMTSELEKFGVKYGAVDVYASVYDSANPFTWNYSSVVINGTSQSWSAWQDIYSDLYGTPRPDLQPWKLIDLLDESSFIAACISAGILHPTTTSFDLSMWPAVRAFVISTRTSLGKTSIISIDSNGALQPPYSYVDPSQSLLALPPDSAATSFAFGQNGPVEMFWRKTIDYIYSKQKCYFKINPLEYVNQAWGIKQITVNDYVLDPLVGRKTAPSDFKLHGDTLDDLAQLSWINVTKSAAFTTPPLFDHEYSFTCVSRLDGVFKVTLNDNAAANCGFVNPTFVKVNGAGVLEYTDEYLDVKITPSLRDFFWGDSFKVTMNSAGEINVTSSPQVYYRAEGLNQAYVQYGRIYGEDLQISINRSLYKDWTVKLGYRVGGLLNTDSLTIKSQDVPVDGSAFNVLLKENRFYNSVWLNALRVQLVKVGSTDLINGYNVPSIGPNGTPGEDWIFRIDNFNEARTSLSWYEYDLNGSYNTFVALDGTVTLNPWMRFNDKLRVRTLEAPFLITGIQNLVNFIFGYSDKLEDDGWRFNDSDDPILDPNTGRPISYQLLVEKFIVQQFLGVAAGTAYLFNPFSRKVWFKSPHGVVSGMNTVLGLEQETICTVLTADRKQVPITDIRVFRQDEQTEMVFDQDVFTLHLLVSEYEHVLIFNDYSVDTLLLYDAFLGQRTSRVFLQGNKQSEFTGRLDFGGHFLLGEQMKVNLESSISNLTKYYSTDTRDVDQDSVDHARALLGFQKKDYFKKRDTTDVTEFRFWQGMIANKGTNFSVDAFINSASYQDAKLDEYWAYKLADYGDSRPIKKTELKINSSDCTGEHTNYLFVESDDILITDTDERYDMFNYDELGFGNSWTVNSLGMIPILPNDESRWYTYSDLNQISYLTAAVIAEQLIIPSVVGECIVINNAKGLPVRADCFELVDVNYVDNNDAFDIMPYDEVPYSTIASNTYYENGNYIIGSTDPVMFDQPKFKRINSSTIQILDAALVGRTLKAIAYGPAEKQYSPNALIDYTSNVTAKSDIIWWDPARGVQHPQAAASVDLDGKKDPAIYNSSICEYKNARSGKLKPWGKEKVGTIWWDTSELYWAPYSDDKIMHEVFDRLSSWGALSDMSEIKIYEWVKSNTHPSKAALGQGMIGEPAMFNYVARYRTWWQRPVAWKYSSNPITTVRDFMVKTPCKLFNNGMTVSLETGKFEDLGIVVGSKIAAASLDYSSISGTLQVSSEEYVSVENLTSANSSLFTNVKINLDLNALSFREHSGHYTISSNANKLTLTHVPTGFNQEISIASVPAAGQAVKLVFDEMGITITFIVSGASTVSQVNSWVQTLEFDLLSTVDVTVLIPINSNTVTAWVAWNDPTINPIYDVAPPNNNYEPVAGEWIQVGDRLHDVAEDIKVRTSDPWTWFDGSDFTPYKSSWNEWREIQPEIREKRYRLLPSDLPTHLDQAFSFPGETSFSLESRVKVYVNEKLFSNWTAQTINEIPTVVVDSAMLTVADLVRVKLDAYTPTQEELDFDPAVKDEDPFKMVQYKLDYPCVVSVERDLSDNLTQTYYYYWVKNKTLPGASGKLSTVEISNLLHQHDGLYAVPQMIKLYNQLDGRPNRYAVLSIKDLGREVKTSDRFKLRLNDNPTLRDRDANLMLKPFHEEWILLRPNQINRIPKQLWDKLIDTMVSMTPLDQALPFIDYQQYDVRNGTSVSYGLREGQIMTDPALAVATVKHTILNTQVDKYVNGEVVTDYISYPGFSMSEIDTYLSSAMNIRKFMTDLWRFAKPAQINEIFFAVLHDTAAKNLELSDFFKTSFISLSEIRTITISNNQ